MKMLKFEQKMRGSTNVCFITKVGIDQNVGICLKTKELIRILKFEDKIGNRSKCWNLSANHQIVQNDVLWVKSLESIKKLTFGCNKVGIDQNVEILMQNYKSIKMLKSEWKFDINQMLIFYCQSVNQSKCRNLFENKGIDQNIEI